MKQVFLQKGKVNLIDVDIPQINSNSILVKTHYSFISSGTEFATISISGRSLFQKITSNFSQNIQKVVGAVKEGGLHSTVNLILEKLDQVMPLGYSCSGQVIAVGKNIENFVVGDYVACAGSGFANHAELVAVPKNLAVKIKNKEYIKYASLTTIGAIALQGLRRANPMFGEKVCVIGLGLIGQLTIQMAKAAGCQVIGVDIKEGRLDLAKNLGADFVINSSKNNVINEINWITQSHGVDATIITAASSSGDLIQNSMNITRRKGRVVLVGDVKIDFDRDPFYSKEIDFLISCSYGPGRYDESYEKRGIDYPYDYVRWTENRNMEFFANLIQNNKVLLNTIISSEFDLDNVEQAYSALQDGSSLGIILAYKSQQNAFSPKLYSKLNFKSAMPFLACNAKTRLGCVGVGGFAKTKLLPILDKIKNVSIAAIADINPTSMINTARRYKTESTTGDYKNLLASEIDAALIATPHFLHADQSIDFMGAGKAVFVEKPAAANFDQLENLKNFFDSNKDYLYCVDFNRPFSPFMTDIKNVISARHNPAMISYRMNAGFIPKDHWINSPQNGGRIIGEACHIFDLFLFLTDAKPVKISVQTINTSGEMLNTTDNFIAQLSMDDGSCCSLFYSALGSGELGKERMEIFFDGKAIVMDDFYLLSGYGLPHGFNKISKVQDKGHEALLKKFFVATQTQNFDLPIPISRILLTTQISLIIDELARRGGGWQDF
jgi:predicted dehydrogenase/threonine dehydrogenase-like Zn-dependent dehydrogenase